MRLFACGSEKFPVLFPVIGLLLLLRCHLQRFRLGLVMGRSMIERGNHQLPGTWRSGSALAHDFARGNLAPVDLLIGAVVLPKRRAFERDASEEPASSRIGENLGAHGDVSGSFGVAAFGTGG